ncbi:diguanylate cyclase (GGDEF) domain-containing protein [Desulfosporosinus acidiphilus SJ4]|uniref:Diguanylate cyclase (GGDEF) domain-containing protein n=1 Tax=Desulfosporosinus acidiphilus (strain DSM 22704 / JCM 16185 / SJ4) TaxID=646529 RepID=I4DAW4_DESAJ|nr:diguanylate cyclase [Desulfosporosinus acidiphilus]AFM42938.1 diguanylate cyclase (GGDEF) domain-containing protein [Desulfosporosinus acidiphilus SJ4]
MSLPKPDATKCEETIARVLQTMSAFILMVDADGLKGINDKYGHPTGTAYLTELWDRLHSAFPHTLWHRYGGDEFYGVMTAHKVNEADLFARAENITGMAQIHGRDILVACSIGLYTAGKEESAIAAMAMADHAMYQIKKNHHGGIKVFRSDRSLALIGEWSEDWITVPVSEGWRVLVYSETTSLDGQPQVDLVIARRPLPGSLAPVWVPENNDISNLIKKLHAFSLGDAHDAPNPAANDLIWEDNGDRIEEPPAPPAYRDNETDSEELSSPTELFTTWGEPPKDNNDESAIICHQEVDMSQEFIPWRSVKPTLWDQQTLEEVPIIMDDPLTQSWNEKEKPVSLEKKQTNFQKAKSRTAPKSSSTLKPSTDGIKQALSSVLSSLERPRLEIPHLNLKEFRELVPEMLPKNLPKWSKEETPQGRSPALPNPLSVDVIESLKGKILWFWSEKSGTGVTHLANHTAQILSLGLPVLLLDGDLIKPSLVQQYPCDGPGWEKSWLRKMPGKHPEHVITEGNLRVWVLKQPVGPFTDPLNMWEVALFHLRSPDQIIVIDGGQQMPPPDVDLSMVMLSKEMVRVPNPTHKTVWVSRQWMEGTLLYDGSQFGILGILEHCKELLNGEERL